MLIIIIHFWFTINYTRDSYVNLKWLLNLLPIAHSHDLNFVTEQARISEQNMTSEGVGDDSCHAKCVASHPPVGRTVTLSSETDTWCVSSQCFSSVCSPYSNRQWPALPITIFRGAGCTWRTRCSSCSPKATTLCPSPNSHLCALLAASTCALCRPHSDSDYC